MMERLLLELYSRPKLAVFLSTTMALLVLAGAGFAGGGIGP